MRIALIGSRDAQQFPTISYGGIETCVENLAWGLHKSGKDFVCIVPRRETKRPYPFEIVESDVPPIDGPEYNVWPFAYSLKSIVRQLAPDVIWSQSFWSAETLQDLNIPIICTFHDYIPSSRGIKERWFSHRKNTWYRFISRFQYNQWVDPKSHWQLKRSFYQYTGLANEEYCFGPKDRRQDHFLWVAGLNWGKKIKGLDIFIELAKRNPDKRFVAYGKGYGKIMEELYRLNEDIDGFEFRGELNRGQEHRNAFAEARAFIMPTQMPEPFGRTIIESMSKGTPVLGSSHGALPELIENGLSGFTTGSMETLEGCLDYQFDNRQCFEYSKRFHINEEIAALIDASEKILAKYHKQKTYAYKADSALEPSAPGGPSNVTPVSPGSEFTVSNRNAVHRFINFGKRILDDVWSEGDTVMDRRLIDRMVPEFVRCLPDGEINLLDVGNDQGYACHKFRELGFQHLTAVRMCREDVAAMRKRGFNCYSMDTPFLKFEDHLFDALWVRHILERSPYPYLALLEFNRVLKAKKVIYLEMPQPGDLRDLENRPSHYSMLGDKMWEALFTKSGFQIIYSATLRQMVQEQHFNDGASFAVTNFVYILKKISEETV
jgi:glycosyltransferase involved in cell wall biosynthesis/SAM-dependent methyltransferase